MAHIRRTTTRSGKDICDGGTNAYYQHTKVGGVIRFVVATDNMTFHGRGMERFIVGLTAEEVRRLVLQVPATKMISLLGPEAANKFADDLAKVLAIEPSGY